MKNFFAGRLMVALATAATLCFAACGGDDDEPSVDETLSKETTPITFDLDKGTHFLFDFAGSNLVGADTIDIKYSSRESYNVNLRQGKHRLLWMRGLSGASISGIKDKVKGVDYDPKTDMVVSQSANTDFYVSPLYCIKNIEVAPYLMPTQELEYQHLCARLGVIITSETYIDDIADITIQGFPFVKSVGLDDNRCTTGESVALYLNDYSVVPGNYSIMLDKYTLCPKDGLDNVELSLYKAGVKVASLPKISLQRGQVTLIKGPLSGESGDFTVTTR